LSTYQGGMLVVSHDLPLLDEAITSVLALEHGVIEAYRGNYSHYLVERDLRQERKERERRHQDEAIARLEENIRRFKGTTEKMAKTARAWETRVERMKRDLVDVQKSGRKVKLAFPQPERSGRVPLAASGLAKSFGDNIVFVDIEFAVERGERMLLIGLNGAGKTTLLRILAGVDTADLGEVSLGHLARLGYYAQEHEQIFDGVTVFDHMRKAARLPDSTLRGLLGHFLWPTRSTRMPPPSRVGRRPSSPSPCWLRLNPTCCCWTSRPTTSTPKPRTPSSTRSPCTRAPSSWSATTPTSSPN